MAEDDIYGNKRRYERFKANLTGLLKPAEQAGKQKIGRRKHYIKNKANIAYFGRLFRLWDAKDTSYIRRNRLLSDFMLICHATSKDMKDCKREDIDSIMAFMHPHYKSGKSKADFVRHIKYLWKSLFPELDEKSRPDEKIVPYVVRHLEAKVGLNPC